MAPNKDKIHELVEIFYQKPPFKTFYVNSTDGENFVKPTGVFISLGITTSLKILEDLRDILSKTPGLKSKLVEIKSTKVSGTFMNSISKENPEQYEVSEDSVKPNIVLGKDEAEKEVEDLESLGKRDESAKLHETICRVNEDPNPWINKKIMKLQGGGYRVFHRYVNYKKTDDAVEYRLGIYVEETT